MIIGLILTAIVEQALFSSNLHTSEIRNGTYEQLRLAVDSYEQIYRQKIAARRKALKPTLIMLAAALVWAVVTHGEAGLAMALATVVLLSVMLYHVQYWACYLSLLVPGGVWALAIFVVPFSFALAGMIPLFGGIIWLIMIPGIPHLLRQATRRRLGEHLEPTDTHLPAHLQERRLKPE